MIRDRITSLRLNKPGLTAQETFTHLMLMDPTADFKISEVRRMCSKIVKAQAKSSATVASASARLKTKRESTTKGKKCAFELAPVVVDHLQVCHFIDDDEICRCCSRKRDQCVRSRRAKETAWADDLAQAVRDWPREGTCWGCNKTAPASSLKTCSRCLDEKLTVPALFCSEACLRANWKRHREWHKEWHPRMDTHEICKPQPFMTDSTPRGMTSVARGVDENDFNFCFDMGIRYHARGESAQAVTVLKRAMKLKPDDHRPYHECAMAYAAQSKFLSAAPLALQALARCSAQHWDLQGTELAHGNRMWQENWALIFSLCVDLLGKQECVSLPRPSWWNDAELKAMSAKAMALLPLQGYTPDMANNIYICRASILDSTWYAAMPGIGWTAGSRTDDEWREAGDCCNEVANIARASSRDIVMVKLLRQRSSDCYARTNMLCSELMVGIEMAFDSKGRMITIPFASRLRSD